MIQSTATRGPAPFPWHAPQRATDVLLHDWVPRKIRSLTPIRGWVTTRTIPCPDLYLICASTKCTADMVLSTLCLSQILNAIHNPKMTWPRPESTSDRAHTAYFLPYLPIARADLAMFGDVTHVFRALGVDVEAARDCFLFNDSLLGLGILDKPSSSSSSSAASQTRPGTLAGTIQLVLLGHHHSYWNDKTAGGPLVDELSLFAASRTTVTATVNVAEGLASYAQHVINGIESWKSMLPLTDESKNKTATDGVTDAFAFWRHPHTSALLFAAMSLHTEHFSKTAHALHLEMEMKALRAIRGAIPLSLLLDLKGLYTRMTVSRVQTLASLDAVDMLRMHTSVLRTSVRAQSHDVLLHALSGGSKSPTLTIGTPTSTLTEQVFQTCVTQTQHETKTGPSVRLSYLEVSLTELLANGKRMDVLSDMGYGAGGASCVHLVVCRWTRESAQSWKRYILCYGKSMVGASAKQQTLDAHMLSFMLTTLKCRTYEEKPVMAAAVARAEKQDEESKHEPTKKQPYSLTILVECVRAPEPDEELEQQLLQVLNTFVPVLQ